MEEEVLKDPPKPGAPGLGLAPKKVLVEGPPGFFSWTKGSQLFSQVVEKCRSLFRGCSVFRPMVIPCKGAFGRPLAVQLGEPDSQECQVSKECPLWRGDM